MTVWILALVAAPLRPTANEFRRGCAGARSAPEGNETAAHGFSDASYTHVHQQTGTSGRKWLFRTQRTQKWPRLVIKTSRTTDASPGLLALAVSGLAGIGLP